MAAKELDQENDVEVLPEKPDVGPGTCNTYSNLMTTCYDWCVFRVLAYTLINNETLDTPKFTYIKHKAHSHSFGKAQRFLSI